MTACAAGCVPVPVSTVALHPREDRAAAVESAVLPGDGIYAAPAFDTTGAHLAVYDSAANRVRILRSADLVSVQDMEPRRRPRRLGFSPGGNYLVIEAHQGWVADYLNAPPHAGHVEVDSPEAIRDDIQRAEIWNLRSGATVSELSCDAVTTSEPQRGWLWARKWAITPGYRSSALLEAHFSADESEFSMLCWNGVQQRWDCRMWQRLDDVPPPPFWDAAMQLTTAQWLAGNDVATRSVDGRHVALRLREKAFGFATLYLWDRDTTTLQSLPGECASRIQPDYALSGDARTIVAVCSKGMGYSLRAWRLDTQREIHLRNADFGIGSAPLIRGAGVALSPDGRYLAVALLNLTEALLIMPVPAPVAVARSDLRIWSLDGGAELVSVPIDGLSAYGDYFRGVDVAFSPDSAMLAVAGRQLRIYRTSDLGAAVP